MLPALIDIGFGDHNILDGDAAEPDGVAETTARLPPHNACCTVAKSRGAGVMVVVITRVSGLHAPGGFMVKVNSAEMFVL